MTGRSSVAGRRRGRALIGSLTLVLLVSATPARAQTVDWTRVFGTRHHDDAWGVAVDATGVYVAGDTNGTLPGQSSAGGLDVYLRKFLTSGSVAWTSQFGTGGTDYGFMTAVDATGVYVTGFASGKLAGRPYAGSGDAFVRRYDTSGNVLWTREFGTPELDAAFGAATDATGVYVIGETKGAFPGQRHPGKQNGFIAKYDASGSEQWIREFGARGANTNAVSVSTDGAGVTVVGRTSGSLHGQTARGGTDAFVRRYDSSGHVLWTRQFGTRGTDVAEGVAADATGIYVDGLTTGTLHGQTSAGATDAFVRRFDPSGARLWTSQFGTRKDDFGYSTAVDAAGVYVTGQTFGAFPGQSGRGAGDVFVRKLDLTSGAEQWTLELGSRRSDAGYWVAADPSGLFVTGATSGSIGGQTPRGASDAFLSHIS